jgi:hypothetical protein
MIPCLIVVSACLIANSPPISKYVVGFLLFPPLTVLLLLHFHLTVIKQTGKWSYQRDPLFLIPLAIGYLGSLVAGSFHLLYLLILIPWAFWKCSSIVKAGVRVKKTAAGLTYAGLLLLLVIGSEVSYFWAQYDVVPWERMWAREALHRIRVQIEAYAVNHEGRYPQNIAEALEANSRSLEEAQPRNPYDRRRFIKEVPWGTISLGDVSYWVSKDAKAYCVGIYIQREESAQPEMFIFWGSGEQTDGVAGMFDDAPEQCKEKILKAGRTPKTSQK